MFPKFTKAEKAVFVKLKKAGHDIYCCGKGWVINDTVYESYAAYYVACKNLAG
jgi:hypothetical protein